MTRPKKRVAWLVVANLSGNAYQVHMSEEAAHASAWALHQGLQVVRVTYGWPPRRKAGKP